MAIWTRAFLSATWPTTASTTLAELRSIWSSTRSKAGSYAVTAFLHSSNYGNQGNVNIDVIDLLGQRQVLNEFSQSYGTAGPVAQAAMLCHSDGLNPITIHFTEASNPKNVVLSGVTVADVPDGPLKVDFGHSTVEAGFEQYLTPGGPDTGYMSSHTILGPVEQEFLNASGNLGVVTVELASGGRGATHQLQSFNSGDMSGPYPYRDLGKDIIYNVGDHGDDWLEVTLKDLKAGQYEFDAFLHSSYSFQGDVHIDLTDRFGTLQRVVSDFTQSHDSAGPVSQASFFFYANGIDDVVIRLTEADLTLPLNSRNVVMAGFILTSVPEPGSIGLLALGGLLIGALSGRRRPRRESSASPGLDVILNK